MKILPVFILSILKHPAFLENKPVITTTGSSGSSTNNIKISSTQSLLTNTYTTTTNTTTNSTNRLAFIPTYGNILNRIHVRAHERSYELRKLLYTSLNEIINSIYPRFYNITTLMNNINTTTSPTNRNMNNRDNGNDDDRDPGNGEMGNVSYDSISDENLNNSAGSVSFNNLLTRHAPGLQLEHPDATSPGKYRVVVVVVVVVIIVIVMYILYMYTYVIY